MIQNSFYSDEWEQDIPVEYEIVDIEKKGNDLFFKLVFPDEENGTVPFYFEDSADFLDGFQLTPQNVNKAFNQEIQEYLQNEYTIPYWYKVEMVRLSETDEHDY